MEALSRGIGRQSLFLLALRQLGPASLIHVQRGFKSRHLTRRIVLCCPRGSSCSVAAKPEISEA